MIPTSRGFATQADIDSLRAQRAEYARKLKILRYGSYSQQDAMAAELNARPKLRFTPAQWAREMEGMMAEIDRRLGLRDLTLRRKEA